MLETSDPRRSRQPRFKAELPALVGTGVRRCTPGLGPRVRTWNPREPTDRLTEDYRVCDDWANPLEGIGEAASPNAREPGQTRALGGEAGGASARGAHTRGGTDRASRPTGGERLGD